MEKDPQKCISFLHVPDKQGFCVLTKRARIFPTPPFITGMPIGGFWVLFWEGFVVVVVVVLDTPGRVKLYQD